MLTYNITEVFDSFYKKHIFFFFFFFFFGARREWGHYVLVFIVVQFYSYFKLFQTQKKIEYKMKPQMISGFSPQPEYTQNF